MQFYARIALGVMLWSTFIGSSASAAEVRNHPAVTPYVGSIATRRDDDGFRAYKLVTGVNPNGKTDAEALQTLEISGNVVRLAYENPQDRSAHEIFANYREALEKANFEILFSCAESQCGPGFASSRWGRVTGLRYVAPDMRYIAAKTRRDGQDIYVAVLVAKVRHQVEVVEVSEMDTGLVTAQGIADGLLREGRAVLEGIYFDTDKATIKSESRAALEVIAEFLRSHPQLQVFIVGHTDSTGQFDHNMRLSKDRAAAVTQALINDYGIAAARLDAQGVGPLSPTRTNASEPGRGVNRRVEMVER